MSEKFQKDRNYWTESDNFGMKGLNEVKYTTERFKKQNRPSREKDFWCGGLIFWNNIDKYKEEGIKKNEENLYNTWDGAERKNIHIIGLPGRGGEG